MTIGNSKPPKTTTISTFCIAYRIFVVVERRDFKFGGQAGPWSYYDQGKSQPTDEKQSLKGTWSGHVTNFKFLVPLKYPWNGQT